MSNADVPGWPPSPPPPPPYGMPGQPPPVYGAAPPAGQWGPAPYMQPPPRRSGLAIAALVLGIIGVAACFVFVFSLLALVFGLVSARVIKRSDGIVTGLKMARAGWILGIVGLLIGGAFIAAGLSGAFDDEGVTRLGDVEVGDCVDIADVDADAISELPTVECTELHEGEVYVVGQMNSDRDRDFPGNDEVDGEAARRCSGDAFTDYIGATYAESEFEVFYIYPRRLQWNKDRGEFICIAYSLDGPVLTGSIRNSNR